MRAALIRGVVILVVGGLGACASTPPADTLYADLGGERGVAAIVDGMIRNIAADDTLRPHFRNIHIRGFRQRLETHFCDVAARTYPLFSSPKKQRLNCTIPALVKSSVGSSAGTSDELLTT